MKKLLFALTAAIFFLNACKEKCIEDTGIHLEHTTNASRFEKISIEGNIRLVLKQDSSYTVKVTTDSNLMALVTMKVSGGELKLGMKNHSYCGQDSVVIEAGIGMLNALTAGGSVRIGTEGIIYAREFKLNISGTTDVSLGLNTSGLTTTLDGTSKLRLSGQTGRHDLSITGNADIEAADFIAGNYDVRTTGNAKAYINVLNELNVKTEGASEIYYRGNPKKVNNKKNGTSVLEPVK